MNADAPAAVPQLALRDEWTPLRVLLGDIYARRDLCTTLARKDFFVRYRRATFGLLWAVALPALQAGVLSIVLSRVARISTPHYSLFILSGIVAWTYVSTTLAAGSTAIVDNSALSSRIYFPRAVLPLSSCLANAFALVIGDIVLIAFAIGAGAGIGWHTLYLIPAGLLLLVFMIGLTLVLSAAHVYFRDINYVVQAVLLVWFYATPIFYPLDLIHGWVRTVITINPLTGVVDMFNAGAVGGSPISTASLGATAGWTVGLLVIAAVVHCRYDRAFADLL